MPGNLDETQAMHALLGRSLLVGKPVALASAEVRRSSTPTTTLPSTDTLLYADIVWPAVGKADFVQTLQCCCKTQWLTVDAPTPSYDSLTILQPVYDRFTLSKCSAMHDLPQLFGSFSCSSHTPACSVRRRRLTQGLYNK